MLHFCAKFHLCGKGITLIWLLGMPRMEGSTFLLNPLAVESHKLTDSW